MKGSESNSLQECDVKHHPDQIAPLEVHNILLSHNDENCLLPV